MALAMIVLAGFLLAGIARHSFDAALEAITARQDLQLRWGNISCQRLLLDQADDLFASLQSPDEQAPAPLSTALASPIEIVLGGITFRLQLADENCKTNLNTVFLSRGEEVLRRVCRDATSTLTADPRPLADEDAGSGRTFECWSQVFAPSNDSDALPFGSLGDATQSITCWGDGRVNIRRASDDVVRTVGRLAVSAKVMRDLLAIRRQYPDASLQDWLKRLAADRESTDKLRRLFGEDSRCFSLWIEAVSNGLGRETGPSNYEGCGRETGPNNRGSNNGGRPWNELLIVEKSDEEANRLIRFVW